VTDKVTGAFHCPRSTDCRCIDAGADSDNLSGNRGLYGGPPVCADQSVHQPMGGITQDRMATYQQGIPARR